MEQQKLPGLNLNITNGSQTNWITRDGRIYSVNMLSTPHLVNIVEYLWLKAEKQFSDELEQSKWLCEYCPTYRALIKEIRKRLHYYEVTGYGRPTPTTYAKYSNKKFAKANPTSIGENSYTKIKKNKNDRKDDLNEMNIAYVINSLEAIYERLNKLERKS